MTARVSVIIPALNAAGTIGRTIDGLVDRGGSLIGEVIVADGGSMDATCAISAANGAVVLHGPAGRGAQLAAGARAASAVWLLFLHADTWLEPGWDTAVRAFVDDPSNARRAAAFRFVLDDASPSAKRLEAIVDWRCRTFALPYGDQGLLIGRAFYDSLGGFKPLPLMEDVDLVRRVGRHRLALLAVGAVTSAARYRRSGYLGRSARNLSCLTLFFLGVPPRFIARFYG